MNISLALVSHGSIEKLIELSKAFHLEEALDDDPEQIQRAFTFLQQNPSSGDIFLIQHQKENDAEVLGFVVLCYSFSLEHGGRIATIDQFYLAPEWRRKKVGTIVLPLLEKRALNQSCTTILLEVNIGNKGARQFYEKFDYMPRRQHYIMSKKIS